MNCTICNNEINPSKQFCGNCDFEVMIISNDASDELKDYVLNRQEVYKKNYQDKNSLYKQLDNIKKDLSLKNKENLEANTLIEKQSEEINKFKGKIATTQEELNRLKSFENLANAKIIEIEKLHNEIVELKKKVFDTTKFKELNNLLKEAINSIASGNQELHKSLVTKYNKLNIK